MQYLINIDVDDLDTAAAFYERAVGLRRGRQLFDGSVIELIGSASPIYLVRKESGTAPSKGASQLRSYERHWTPVHLDFVVEDLDEAVCTTVASGARLEVESKSYKWGRLAMLSDPFGHGFCFVQWLGKGYDEVT